MAYTNVGNVRAIASTATGIVTDKIVIKQPAGAVFLSSDSTDGKVYRYGTTSVLTAALFSVYANMGGSSNPFLGQYIGATGGSSVAETAISGTT